MARERRWGRLVLAVVVASAGAAGCSMGRRAPAAVIGVPEGTSAATPGPLILTPSTVDRAPLPGPPADLFVDGAADRRVRPEPRAGSGMIPADGAPPRAAIPFTTSQPVPDGLVFILVAGSDARPREDLFRTRADSIHLVAVNPTTGEGTLLGIPRDAWVEIPGHGRDKINNALALGGPNLLAAAVRRLTGLPVDYYVLTGFTGLTRMVDDLGGVDVLVDRRMNDRVSGARFERGWHRMSGAEALAFTRNRNDVANGDFSRSENQGRLILAALVKMRAEVADDAGLARWVGVMLNHVRLDIPRDRLPTLAALARRLDPDRVRNVVAPGRIGSAGAQSVVYLTRDAARLFEDLRADAVVGAPAAGPPVTPAATTSTTAPAGGPGSTTTTTRGSTTTTTKASTTTTGKGSTTTTTTNEATTTSTGRPEEPTTSTTRESPVRFFDEPGTSP